MLRKMMKHREEKRTLIPFVLTVIVLVLGALCARPIARMFLMHQLRKIEMQLRTDNPSGELTQNFYDVLDRLVWLGEVAELTIDLPAPITESEFQQQFADVGRSLDDNIFYHFVGIPDESGLINQVHAWISSDGVSQFYERISDSE